MHSLSSSLLFRCYKDAFLPSDFDQVTQVLHRILALSFDRICFASGSAGVPRSAVHHSTIGTFDHPMLLFDIRRGYCECPRITQSSSAPSVLVNYIQSHSIVSVVRGFASLAAADLCRGVPRIPNPHPFSSESSLPVLNT